MKGRKLTEESSCSNRYIKEPLVVSLWPLLTLSRRPNCDRSEIRRGSDVERCCGHPIFGQGDATERSD